jgi:hypothetical protein
MTTWGSDAAPRNDVPANIIWNGGGHCGQLIAAECRRPRHSTLGGFVHRGPMRSRVRFGGQWLGLKSFNFCSQRFKFAFEIAHRLHRVAFVWLTLPSSVSAVEYVAVGPGGPRAMHSMNIGVLFVPAVLQPWCDAGLRRCAGMMRFVVLNFRHVQSPLVPGGFEGYECAARSIFDRADLESWSNWPAA